MADYKVIKKNIDEIKHPENKMVDYKSGEQKDLKGVLKGVKISKEDVEQAKKSLFPDKLYDI